MVRKINKTATPTSSEPRVLYLPRSAALFIALVAFLFSSCGAHNQGSDSPSTDKEKADRISHTSPTGVELRRFAPQREIFMSLVISPPEAVPLEMDESENALPVYEEPGRVPPISTAWGQPWNHRGLILRMDDILRGRGVVSEPMRVRMIAHAIVASGWKQNVWNYNAWGVQMGSWDGKWFIKSTLEMDEDGRYYTVWDAKWRSFTSWNEAVDDYIARIHPKSTRDPYKEAYKWLVDEDKWADITYWSCLKKGKYFTDRQFTSRRFASVCNRVRSELNIHQ